MRVAINFEAPAMEQALRQYFPALEIFSIPEAGATPAVYSADVLLTAAAGRKNLPELLANCTGLKWVHIFGTGADTFPMELVKGRLLTCSRGASAVPIAEWALAMMLGFEKQLPQSWVTEPPKTWFMANLGCLEKKTLGILGFGSIGQEVAKRALAFNMRVIAKVRCHRPSPMPGVELVENIDQLLREADHLLLALPATQESKGILGADNLAKTKPGVHLINVARANLIDQQALKALLDSGHIATASLDVVEPEPLPAGHWLYSHARVRLSPHISWSGPEVLAKTMTTFMQNLAAYQQGQPLDGVVNVSAGY